MTLSDLAKYSTT